MIEIINAGGIMDPSFDDCAPDDIFAPHTPAAFSTSADPVEWVSDQRARIAASRFPKMTLEVAHGVSELAIAAATGHDDLVTVDFTGGRPRIGVEGDVVRIHHGRDASLLTWLTDLLVHGVCGPTRVALGDAASWTLHMKAGTSELRADLSHVLLDALEISGGASDVALTLPRPRGIVRVKIRGGASSVRIERPCGVAMRIQMTGGASDLTFDGSYVEAIGGRYEVASRGFEEASDRYQLEVSGGASEISIVESEKL
jgi:hypothetical protein